MNSHQDPQIIEPDRRKWHINRSVNIDTMLTMLAMLAGFFLYAMNQQERMVTIENFVKAHEGTDKRMAERYEQDRREMREDIKEIKSQLETLTSRRRN